MARNVYEKEKLAHEKAITDEIEVYEQIIARADGEGRRLTDEENEDIAHSVKKVKLLQKELEEVEDSIKSLDEVRDIGRKMGPAFGNMSVTSEPQDRMFEQMNKTMFVEAQQSIGEKFVSAEGYKSAREALSQSGRLPSNFSTGQISMDMKGTLLSGSGSPGSGTGGGLLPVPQVQPGVVDKLFQRLTIADLILDGQATENTVRYIVEGTATSGAAGVAEGGAKPESLLGLSTVDEPIKKIATLLPVSEEMLEDAAQVQSYINGRLIVFVKNEEERQLFRGSSTNEVKGLLDSSRAIPSYSGGTAVGNKAVQAFKGLNSMRGSALIEPEWIVMHPTDWENIRLLTDSAGQFFGGGPFGGQYGGGVGQTSPSSQIVGAPQDTLWGKPVYVTGSIGNAGTALVGTRSNAQVWRKGGLSVEATNSHSTYFANNLVAIRAEERLGLAVYRAAGYLALVLS